MRVFVYTDTHITITERLASKVEMTESNKCEILKSKKTYTTKLN